MTDPHRISAEAPGVQFPDGEPRGMSGVSPRYRTLKTLDELLERDNQREKDGFRRKISLGKIVKPIATGEKKFVIVPTTTEDKFYHDSRVTEGEDDSQDQEGEGDTDVTTGAAEGEEGDVIGERPLETEGQGSGQGAGSGQGEEHEVGAGAYELGKILTEKFQLPNLKEKGKKRSLTKYIYDLTDRNRGSGQFLDKKATLRQLLKTNIALGRVSPESPIEPDKLLISPRDYVYRVMSREKDLESRAIVFFVRDYSGSMNGRPTELVCSQHVMIYSWLMYQYREQVESRFILHDDHAKEAPNFYTYHNLNVAGGTEIMAAFKLVNQIVNKENLASEYNIYVFYGSDGDDWQSNEKEFVDELETLFGYISRLGMTIVRGPYATGEGNSKFERFIKKHGFLEKYPKLARMDALDHDADDQRLVESIRTLVS